MLYSCPEKNSLRMKTHDLNNYETNLEERSQVATFCKIRPFANFDKCPVLRRESCCHATEPISAVPGIGASLPSILRRGLLLGRDQFATVGFRLGLSR